MHPILTKGALGAALLTLAVACAEIPAPAPVTAPDPAPVAAAVAPSARLDMSRALPIFFEEWSARLDQPAEEALQDAARLADASPRTRLLVIGFAAPRGSREANLILARLRARIVADTLIENGVRANRIRILYRGATAGFGELESRRVEVRVDRGQR